MVPSIGIFDCFAWKTILELSYPLVRSYILEVSLYLTRFALRFVKVFFLYFIHVEIVFLVFSNLSDAAPLVTLFSISRLILHFCISDTLLSFHLIADILRLNDILLYYPTMFSLLINVYIKCNYRISKIDHFSSIL